MEAGDADRDSVLCSRLRRRGAAVRLHHLQHHGGGSSGDGVGRVYSMRNDRTTPVPDDSPLLVVCWCGRTYVKTTQRNVWSGIVPSCGRVDCTDVGANGWLVS